MSEKLIFNPFLQIHLDENEKAGFLLFAPKKGESLKILSVKESENKDLYQKISDNVHIGFTFLDIETELSKKEIELFEEFGVLIGEDHKSELPLFSCQLNDIEIKDEICESDNLIVNPTLRFEPFNLVNFKTWIPEKHLSPHQSTVWIKQPVTEIEIGYWLDQDQAQIISSFQNGEAVPNGLDKEMLAKLFSAQIIISRKALENEVEEWTKKIQNAHRLFTENKYVVIEKLLPKSQIKAMQKFYREYIAEGFMEFGDGQVERRFRQHNEPLAKLFLHNFEKLMGLVAGEEIIATYCYAASYAEDAELRPHTDREQCEFSVSFQVDYNPLPENEVSPWSLHLASPENIFKKTVKFEWEEFLNNKSLSSKTSAVNLANGDGLFYKGRDLIHYRFPLPKNNRSTSVFFHFVPKDFEGKLI